MIEPYFNEDGITIYNADCLEIMKQFKDKSFDLVLTDPPYGIKRDSGFGGFGGFGEEKIQRRIYDDNWDNERPNKDYFDNILRVSKKAIIFGGNYFADLLPQGKHWLVWDKLNTMPSFGDCELIWTNFDRNSVKKYVVQWNGLLGKEKNRYHPTQKPLALILRLVREYTNINDIILDPFIGSGTILVAAKELNRRAVGIELEKKYCDIAIKRIKNIPIKLFKEV